MRFFEDVGSGHEKGDDFLMLLWKHEAMQQMMQQMQEQIEQLRIQMETLGETLPRVCADCSGIQRERLIPICVL